MAHGNLILTRSRLSRWAALGLCFGVVACSRTDEAPPSTGGGPLPAHPAMRANAPAAPAADPHAHGLPAGHPPVPDAPAAIPSPPQASPPPAVAAAPATATGAAERSVQTGLVVLEVPEGWVRRPPASGFSIAEFGLPKVEGDAEDGRFTVSMAGGSVDQNVSRWRSQFKENPEPVTSSKDANGLKILSVQLAGTLLGGGPMARGGAEKPGSLMWGAVVQVPGSDQNVFLKATGPQKTLEHWKPGLEAVIQSLRKQ